MSDFILKTPIAFIIFNRPDATERVFAEIAKAKPPKLLVVGDGARANRVGEATKVAAARAIINRVNWDCEVLINFSEVNLGCKQRVSSGLDWVFEQVEDAIILEDDCLPHPTFFRFCEELLEFYRDDHRVGMISGDNFQFGYRLNDDSYYFSNFNHIWGWASWRSRWQSDYDVAMKHWPKIRDEGRDGDWFGSKSAQRYLSSTFGKVYDGKIDTWDYQWNFGSRLNGRIAVMPNVNLISNIGFGVDATHTTGGGLLANMQMEEIGFPLKHPIAFFASTVLDDRYAKKFLSLSFYRKVKAKVANLHRRWDSSR